MSLDNFNSIESLVNDIYEMTHPYIIFCNPNIKNQIEEIMKSNPKDFSLYTLETSQAIEESKIYIIDRSKISLSTRGNGKSWVHSYPFEESIFSKNINHKDGD